MQTQNYKFHKVHEKQLQNKQDVLLHAGTKNTDDDLVVMNFKD